MHIAYNIDNIERRRRKRRWWGDEPLHPQDYYIRSSESLLKRVYTGLGVDSSHPFSVNLPPSRRIRFSIQ